MKNRTELMAKLLEKADWLIMYPKTDHYGNYSSEYKTAFDEYCRLRAELAEVKERSAEEIVAEFLEFETQSDTIHDIPILEIVKIVEYAMHEYASQSPKMPTEEECKHPYAHVYRKMDYEKCLKCGKVLCEG